MQRQQQKPNSLSLIPKDRARKNSVWGGGERKGERGREGEREREIKQVPFKVSALLASS